MQYETKAIIDWLQVTVEREIAHSWIRPMPSWPVTYKVRGYKKTVALKNGGTISFSDDKQSHYVFTGQSLLAFRSEFNIKSLLAAIENAGIVNVSRIDLAFDVTHTQPIVPWRYSHDGESPLKSRMKENAKFASPTNGPKQSGMSIYFGSPRSKKRLVIYDKNAEQGIADADAYWTRYEMRFRNEQAVVAFHLAAQHGVEKASMSLLSKMGEAECPIFKHLTSEGNTALVPYLPRKKPAYQTWLEQVAASIIKRQESDKAAINAFLAILAKEGII